MFEAAGRPDMKMPDIKMAAENGKVATYHPGNNIIELDPKAYDVCLEMGKDSLNALAFIIGHELAHSFQTEVRTGNLSTNFLSYDRIFSVPTRIEKVADIQGVFTAYLAGFYMGNVVPKLLPRLYDAYHLTGKTFKGYPPLEERNLTAKEVLGINETLIDLYETANYLLVMEKNDIAIACYEYILKYYQGRELYNNLGTVYLLSAFDFFLPETDRFVHPVEIDASSQLTKIEKSRGVYELSPQERQFRNRLLEKSIEYFQQAISLDQNYTTARLNAACALNMLGKPKAALAFLEKGDLASKARSAPELGGKIAIIKGISHALLGDLDVADRSFEAAMRFDNQKISAQAGFNRNVLYSKPETILPEHCFNFPENFRMLMQDIPLGRVSQLEPMPLDENGKTFRRSKTGQTSTFSFGDMNGNIISIVRFKNNMVSSFDLLEMTSTLDRAFFYNLVSTPTGYYLKSKADGLVIQVDNKGKVMELARVFVHR
ncbi:MAG: hypothetical protein H6577_06570 [Lewinellaceae bacterium]|nr:hypothetical protein [Saprospiraceae bacterium]MCB9337772.1 hypothetical protein [Lewinellaceae bacterium]